MNEDTRYHWGPAHTKRMLANRKYTGKGVTVFTDKQTRSFKFSEVAIPDYTYPQIIEDDLFEAVQKRLASYSQDAPYSNKDPEHFLFRGYIYCECGRRITCKTAVRGRSSRYMCSRHFNWEVNRICAVSTCSEPIDQQVWEYLESVAAEVPTIREALQKRLKQDDTASIIARAEKEIAQYEQEIENLQRDLRKGIVPEKVRPSVYSQIEDLQIKIMTVEAIIKDEDARKEQDKREKEILTKLLRWYENIQTAVKSEDELSLEEKQHFFKFVGLRVILSEKDKTPEEKRWKLEVDRSYINLLP